MHQYNFVLRFKLTYLLFVFASFISCNKHAFQREGMIHFMRNLPLLTTDTDRIWFKDSSVIIEVRGDNTVYEDDILIHRGYDVIKYTYLDLRTMRCQDYFSFSDTASPVYNYKLINKDDVIRWDFYNYPRITEKINALSDSVVDGILYKRLKTYKRFPEGYEYIYFMQKISRPNIFHLDKLKDSLNPGWKVLRIDMVDSSSKWITSTKFNVVNTKLSKNEENIFEIWKKNASEIKLKEVSFGESLRIPDNRRPKY